MNDKWLADVNQIAEYIRSRKGWVVIKIGWCEEFKWVVRVTGKYREFDKHEDACKFASAVLLKASLIGPESKKVEDPEYTW